MNDQLKNLSEQVIDAACEVSNVHGAGFLEGVYENALLPNFQKPRVEVKRIIL